MRTPNRNIDYRTLGGPFGVLTIAIMLIIGISAFPNMPLANNLSIIITNRMQDYNMMAFTITVDLFAQEIKYLHDNGFRVLLLNQLGYGPNNNVFDIKNVPLPTYGTTTNATTLVRAPS